MKYDGQVVVIGLCWAFAVPVAFVGWIKDDVSMGLLGVTIALISLALTIDYGINRIVNAIRARG